MGTTMIDTQGLRIYDGVMVEVITHGNDPLDASLHQGIHDDFFYCIGGSTKLTPCLLEPGDCIGIPDGSGDRISWKMYVGGTGLDKVEKHSTMMTGSMVESDDYSSCPYICKILDDFWVDYMERTSFEI
jgi:hypothetical protein